MANRRKKVAKKTSPRAKRSSSPKRKKQSKAKRAPKKTPRAANKPKRAANKPPMFFKPAKERDEQVKLLNENQARTSLEHLSGWQTNNDHKMIYREFKLKDFGSAIQLINRIAKIAENEQHHPDVHLTQFRNLRVAMTTHEVGGLSQTDFVVAEKINGLPVK